LFSVNLETPVEGGVKWELIDLATEAPNTTNLYHVLSPVTGQYSGAVIGLDAANALDDVSITSNLASIEELLDGIDSTINSFATTVNDTTDTSDNNVFNLNIVVSDGTVDVPISNATLSINTTINDTADSVDSGTIDFNPYVSEAYFAETYTTSITTF